MRFLQKIIQLAGDRRDKKNGQLNGCPMVNRKVKLI
jgi:hypothetical protein